jgi:hypothetical protein
MVLTNLDVYVEDVLMVVLIKTATTHLDPLPTVTVDPFSQCPDASGNYTPTGTE